MKFKIGDKVKILAKTAKGYEQEQSQLDAMYPKRIGYVAKIGEKKDFITVSKEPGKDSGNYFKESDLKIIKKQHKPSNPESEFKVGDKITGTTNNEYSITTEDAIMEVVSVNAQNDMRVKIIEHATAKDAIGKSYPVDGKHFRKIKESRRIDEKMVENSVYWECVNNNHKKFWAAHILETDVGVLTKDSPVKKYILVRKWGRIGNSAQTVEQTFRDKSEAEEFLRKLIWVKEKKGYKPVF